MRSGEVLDGVVRQLRLQLGDGPTDGELLAQFANSRDEAAFTALVRRHGGLVFSVARRQLGDRQSAEDVFQNTFLALARQARRLGRPVSLVNWLYTVASRQARKARLAAMRRTARHNRLAAAAPPPDPLSEITARELVAVIDDELARLPETYRLPLLLCAVEGLSRDEAAARLGWSLGAVKGRLERGRDLLLARLEGRGLAVPAVLASVLATDAYAVPAELITTTSRAAAVALIAPAAWASFKTLAAAMLRFSGLGTVALIAQGRRGREQPEFEAPRPPVAQAAASREPAPRVDREGVPLPPEVLTRIGSSRMRHLTTDVVVAPDGRTIASVGVNGVHIWDMATGKLVNVPVVVRDRDAATGIVYAANGDLLCLLRRQVSHVQRLDPATGRERFRIDLDAAPNSVKWFAQSGRRFAYRHKDNSLRIGETEAGRELIILQNLSPQISDIAFSPDDRALAVADDSDTISLFDTATGIKTGEAKHAECIFNSVMISPDGRTLAARRTRQTEVHLWEFPTGKYRGQLPAEDTKTTIAYRFSPDGKALVTSGGWAVPTLWDVAECREIRRFHGVPGAQNVALSRDGKTLVGATGRGTIVLWDVETGRLLPASADPLLWIRGLRFAEGGRQLIGNSDHVAAWDPETGREVRRYARVPYGRGFTTLSPDQRLLACVDDAGMMHLWDAVTGKEVRKLGGDHHIVTEDPLFTPDGRRLIAADSEKRIVIWDVLSGKPLAALSGHNFRVSDLAISADGRKLASVSPVSNPAGENDIRIWDLTTYREIQRFSPHRGQVFTAAFSPDGRYLATAGGVRDTQEALSSGDVQLWDVETGRELRSLTGHTWVVLRLAFSPDGRMLATGSGDNTVRLWEVATGGERHRFIGHSTYISSLAFAPGGRKLAAASDDAPVYIWDVLGLAGPKRLLSAAEVEQAWLDLAAPDAKAAFHAILRLVAVPEVAVALARQRLKPAAAIDVKHVQDLIRQLDSERFAERQNAATELEKFGDRAAAEFGAALKGAATAEVRQTLQRLLDRIEAGTPETLRAIRAVEVLEHIATSAAREHLKTLAAGQPGAEPTTAAAAALKRLNQ